MKILYPIMMATKFVVIIMVIAFIISTYGHIAEASSTYHVDATNGNDSNNGLSAATAWKTIAKVNGTQLYPGDKLLFKRGEVWREQLIPQSGNDTGYITYGAYGTGNKPVLLGSVTKNNRIAWTRKGGELSKIWTTYITESIDVGNLIFNNEESVGIKVWNEEDLDTQGEFWYDEYNSKLEIYSVINPARYYFNIECALNRHIIDETGKSYVIYENLDLRYGGAHGIGGGNVDHIIVRDCDLSYIGGGKHGGGRFGNGIEFWDSSHDTLVERCRLWEIYDAALTTQGLGGGNEKYNQYFRNNIIWNSEYCFEYWNKPETSTTYDIYFENNTCVNAGHGWGYDQRRGVHLMFYTNLADLSEFYVRNNIFYESTDFGLYIIEPPGTPWNGLENVVLDYNLWYQSSGIMISYPPCYYDVPACMYICDEYTMDQFSDYQTDKGQDQYSIAANPLFVDEANNDFHPIMGSLACNLSDTGSYVGALPCVPCSNPPARIVGVGPEYFSSLQVAYDTALNGDTIQSQTVSFTENLNINDPINKSVTLIGGYDCDYNEPPIGKTVLNGNMIISNGTLTIESGTFEVQY